MAGEYRELEAETAALRSALEAGKAVLGVEKAVARAGRRRVRVAEEAAGKERSLREAAESQLEQERVLRERLETQLLDETALRVDVERGLADGEPDTADVGRLRIQVRIAKAVIAEKDKLVKQAQEEVESVRATLAQRRAESEHYDSETDTALRDAHDSDLHDEPYCAVDGERAIPSNVISAKSRPSDVNDMSPCSTEMGGDGPLEASSLAAAAAAAVASASSSAARAKKLEESVAGLNAECSAKADEIFALAASVARSQAAIDGLKDELGTVRETCEDRDHRLHAAADKRAELEASVSALQAQLSTETQQSSQFENRIIRELEPALNFARGESRSKTAEINDKTAQIVSLEKSAEETRVALEQQIDDINNRLQNTLSVLENTQSMLTSSEQRGADLEEQIADLLEGKRQQHDEIVALQDDLRHRHAGLDALQKQLVTVQQSVADREQKTLDAQQHVAELKEQLAAATDHSENLEARAERKENLLCDMEQKIRSLEVSRSSAMGNLESKSSRVIVYEKELTELKQVLVVREAALHEQAKLASRRESCFQSVSAELRGVISERDRDIAVLKVDVSALERRISLLTEELRGTQKTLTSTEEALSSCKRELDDSSASNRRKDGKLLERDEEFSCLKSEFRSAREDVEARDNQIAAQLVSLADKGAKLAGVRGENADLERRLAALQRELQSSQSESGARRVAIDALKADVSTLKSNIAAMEDENAVRDSEVVSLKANLSSAQTETSEMERLLTESSEEVRLHQKNVLALERIIDRSKQQLAVIESHMDGDRTLLKDCREKEEALTASAAELDSAREQVSTLSNMVQQLQEQLSVQSEDMEEFRSKLTSLEGNKVDLEAELATVQASRATVEHSLQITSDTLAALEKTSAEEIADLRATIASLRTVLDERDSSLSTFSESLSQTSMEGTLTKQQLIDSRTRGDRLFARLSAAEHDLAAKKESLAAAEAKLLETRESLATRDRDIERLAKEALERSTLLSHARARNIELATKADAIVKGELFTLRTKLEAKEKAAENLSNWCCFINGKLNTSEKALSEREFDLEVSTTAFRKLETQLSDYNDIIADKDAQLRSADSSRIVECSELRSRIHTLQVHVDDSKKELERVKLAMMSKGTDIHCAFATISDDLSIAQSALNEKEMAISELRARSNSLAETVSAYERDLSGANRTIESLTQDLAAVRSAAQTKTDMEDWSGKSTALEVSRIRSETGYLLVELRKTEADLAAANDTAASWRTKVDELQPLAEATMDAERGVALLTARLDLSEKDSRNRIDLLETQLEEARRERDAAERDCSAALSDYAAMRARLTDAHRRSSKSSMSIRETSRQECGQSLCTVTFSLSGPAAPGSEIAVYILGGDATLGSWNVARRLPLRVTGSGPDGVLRKCDIVLPANISTVYKFAADGPDGSLVWEGGDNRILELSTASSTLCIRDTWRS